MLGKQQTNFRVRFETLALFRRKACQACMFYAQPLTKTARLLTTSLNQHYENIFFQRQRVRASLKGESSGDRQQVEIYPVRSACLILKSRVLLPKYVHCP